MMKLFERKSPKKRSEGDLLKLRIMRQQAEANETNKLLGMITEKEYEEVLSRLSVQIREMEANYSESENDCD